MALLLKNLLFTLIVPGSVGVYVPLFLAQGRTPASGPVLALALILLATGTAIYAWCVRDFAAFGRGTPAPIDSPKRLFVRGLYRYTGNRMYAGVLTVLLGSATLFQSIACLRLPLASSVRSARATMSSLELLVPPPVVALLVGTGMWGGSLLVPSASAPSFRLPLAIAIVFAGLAVSTCGRLAFRNAKTTANPLKPQAATSLVVAGIYRYTRNPMYVGLALVLVGWAAFLWSPWALLGPGAFVAYIARFQITPEERALAALFGEEYSAYKSQVRPWV